MKFVMMKTPRSETPLQSAGGQMIGGLWLDFPGNRVNYVCYVRLDYIIYGKFLKKKKSRIQKGKRKR